jgi:hypothetical protein
MDQCLRLNDVVDSYFYSQGVDFVVKNYHNIREDYYASKYNNAFKKPHKEKDNKTGKE